MEVQRELTILNLESDDLNHCISLTVLTLNKITDDIDTVSISYLKQDTL